MTTRIFLKEEQMANRKKLFESKKNGLFQMCRKLLFS